MKIEIVVDPINLPGQSLASRVAPAPAAVGAPEGVVRCVAYIVFLVWIASHEGYGRRGGPRRGRGRGGGRKRGERPAKSVADLDAEMEVSSIS
jgi:THO complex subunit 4